MEKKEQAIIEQVVKNYSKRDLAVKAAKQIGRQQKQIEDLQVQVEKQQEELAKKDRLIADLTAQKSRAQLEANGIIAEARQQEKAIRTKAEALKADAERRAREMDDEVSRRMENAEAEADSIVETRLLQAKTDIEKLEGQRNEAKRMSTNLNANIIEAYDELIDQMNVQLSEMKDMQVRLQDLSSVIDIEDFKKFDINDYVSSSVMEEPEKPLDAVSIKDDDDGDLFSLTQLDALTDSVRESDNYAVKYEPKIEEQTKEAEVFPVDKTPKETEPQEPTVQYNKKIEEDIKLEKTKPAVVLDTESSFGNDDDDEDDDVFDFELNDDSDFEEDDDFSNLDAFAAALDDDEQVEDDDLDEEDVFDDVDVYDDGKAKSFTDAFMAVSPTVSQDDNDDIDDFDFDDILDDASDDDDLEVVEEAKSPLIVPQRPNRSQRKGGPARWL